MTVGGMASSRPSASALLPLLKPLLLLLPAFFLVLLISLSRSSSSTTPPAAPAVAVAVAVATASDADGGAPFDLDVDEVPTAGSGGEIRIRSGYRSYREYIARQLNKTLDPRLRNLWMTRDWERKVGAFAAFFRRLRAEGLLHEGSRALCVGARTGQEVAALRLVGVADSVGLDLVPSPPLVVRGDFHRQPFGNGTFDFEFSNVFDHALLPARFVGEVERTLRPGGVCVLHVAVRRRGDRYSANDLFSVDALVGLFRESELVVARKVDGFGLDTEVVMRKKGREGATPPPPHAENHQRLRRRRMS